MPEARKLRVFLCHASQDKPVVRELYQRLNAEGWIDPWLDEEKLLPGQDWDVEIEKAVEAADAVIICLSNKSVTKEGYVQKELRFVINLALMKPVGTLFIIPLRLDECSLPRNLHSVQYLDFFPNDRREWAYNRVLESLTKRLDYILSSEIETNNLEKDYSTGHGSDNSKIHKAVSDLYKISKFDFIHILPGKSVDMLVPEGSNERELQIVEIQYHYWISTTTVSKSDYLQFVNSTGHVGVKDDSFLREMVVSYDHAVDYLRWVNEIYQQQLPSGYVLSLPSKAELLRAIIVTDLKSQKNEINRLGVSKSFWKKVGDSLFSKMLKGVIRLAIVPFVEIS